MEFLRIVDWDKHFENHRSRLLKKLEWVSVPNKFDGDGYTELVEPEDDDPLSGALCYAAWMGLVLIASKEPAPRSGVIARYAAGCRRAHDAASLARMTRLPARAFELAIPKLIAIGWLERITLQDNDLQQSGGNLAVSGGTSPGSDYRREGNGREDKTPLPPCKRDARREGDADGGGSIQEPRKDGATERAARATTPVADRFRAWVIEITKRMGPDVLVGSAVIEDALEAGRSRELIEGIVDVWLANRPKLVPAALVMRLRRPFIGSETARSLWSVGERELAYTPAEKVARREIELREADRQRVLNRAQRDNSLADREACAEREIRFGPVLDAKPLETIEQMVRDAFGEAALPFLEKCKPRGSAGRMIRETLLVKIEADEQARLAAVS
jgi:hypothetical protein